MAILWLLIHFILPQKNLAAIYPVLFHMGVIIFSNNREDRCGSSNEKKTLNWTLTSCFKAIRIWQRSVAVCNVNKK